MQLLRESDNGRAGKEVKRPDKKCDPKDYLASLPGRAAPEIETIGFDFGCPASEWQTPSSKLSAFVYVYPAPTGSPRSELSVLVFGYPVPRMVARERNYRLSFTDIPPRMASQERNCRCLLSAIPPPNGSPRMKLSVFVYGYPAPWRANV